MTRNKRGQFASKYILAKYFILVFVTSLATTAGVYKHLIARPLHLITPVGAYTGAEAVPTPTPNPRDLTQYYPLAKSLFGSQWKIALAVAESECNSSRKEWPRCVNSWAKEHSVGWGQINLAKDGGGGKWVHASKIPGKTINDKAEWLMNPENNLLAMHLVWLAAGKSFSPWTGFTSGNYQAQLYRFR